MKRIMIFLALFVSLSSLVLAQKTAVVSEKMWKPQNDEVYLQEISAKIQTEKPVTSVAVSDEVCLALMDGKIYRVEGEKLTADNNAPAEVKKLQTENGAIWALSAKGLYTLQNNQWKQVDNRKFVDLCMHLGKLHAATSDEIFRLVDGKFETTKPADGYYGSDITMVMEDGSQVLADPIELGPVTEVESYSGTLYVLRPGKLVQFDGKTVNEDFIDWGKLPSTKTNNLLSFGNRVYIGTDRGLAELRGAARAEGHRAGVFDRREIHRWRPVHADPR